MDRMSVGAQSWPDVRRDVTEHLANLEVRLQLPFREPLDQMQELGRALALNNISAAKSALETAAGD